MRSGSTAIFYFDLYTRTGSYFESSDLSSLGVPAAAQEKTWLAPFAVRCATIFSPWLVAARVGRIGPRPGHRQAGAGAVAGSRLPPNA